MNATSNRLRSFMETDPKGQLGGLECTDEIRTRMAKASQMWKCTSCGKSNLEIIKECEEAAKKVDNAKVKEVVIPEELKMGWKDEMRPATDSGPSGSSGPSDSKDVDADADGEDAESQELAEGFVQTTPRPEMQSPQQHPYPP